MAKRTETRATAAVKNARKPRAARPAAAKAKTPAKTADAESPKAKKAKTAATKSVTAKAATSAGKGAKGKRVASTKPKSGAAASKAAAKAKPASTKATRKAKAPSTSARAKTSSKTKTGAKAASAKRKASAKAKMPRFLAAELGHPVDHEGEPIGAGSRAALADTELQRYTLQLWRQMQSRRGVNTHIPAMERAGVTIDQIWTAGVTDRLTTSSTPDEVKRYRQKLLFRANLLESILTETVDELQRLGTIDPTPPPAAGEPG